MLRKLRPALRHPTVASIDLRALYESGIRTLILDLDNTLVAYGSHKAGRSVRDWVRSAKRLGIQPVIVSNNRNGRVARVADALKVPFVSGARKPLRAGYLKALARLGAEVRTAAVVGDQVFTDVLGGNRTGLMTILVDPIDRREFFGTRMVRMVERVVLARLPAQPADAVEG